MRLKNFYMGNSHVPYGKEEYGREKPWRCLASGSGIGIAPTSEIIRKGLQLQAAEIFLMLPDGAARWILLFAD